MTTLIVISLGNLRSLDDSAPETLATHLDESPSEFIEKADRAGVLRDLRDRHPGARLMCSPDLMGEGERLGYEAVPMLESVRAERAALALALSTGLPLLDVTDLAWIVALIRAAARLARTNDRIERFWRLSATVTGTCAGQSIRAQRAVIASTSPDPAHVNVTMFATQADADAFFAAVTPWPGRLTEIEHVSLHLTPAYTQGLRAALLDFTGQEQAPALGANRGRDDRSLTDLEALMLAALGFGIADLTEHPDELERVTAFTERDVTLTTTLSVQVSRIGSGTYRGTRGWWG
jgi:hypothetical protein